MSTPQAAKALAFTIGAKVTIDRVPKAAHKNIAQQHLQTGVSLGHSGHYRRPRRKHLIRSAAGIKIS
jgi:hypothetical protein